MKSLLARNEYAMTVEEIAAVEGISRECVRQIIARALSKLKYRQTETLIEMEKLSEHLQQSRWAAKGADYVD